MGWSGWSFLRLGADTAQVEGEAKALVSTGLAAAGYQYVNLDDGWYQCPGPQGPNVDGYGRWVVNTANYPNVGSENGIQALAAYVHSLGLKFGIYETPGISGQAVAQNTPILGTSYTADDIATTKPQTQLQLRRHGLRSTTARRARRRTSTRSWTSSRPGAWTTSSSTGSATATAPTSRPGRPRSSSPAARWC